MPTPMEIAIAVVLIALLFPGAIVKRYFRKKGEKFPTGDNTLKNKTVRILTSSLLIVFSTIFGIIAPFFLIFDVYHLLLDWSTLTFLISSADLLFILQLIGLILYIIGYTVYLIGRISIGERFAELWSPGRISEDFAQTGIFSRWRHPLYTGSIIFSLGTILMFQTWFGLALYLFPMIVMIKASFAEEQWLLQRFGEKYEQYMKKSWRFFPKF